MATPLNFLGTGQNRGVSNGSFTSEGHPDLLQNVSIKVINPLINSDYLLSEEQIIGGKTIFIRPDTYSVPSQ